MEEQFHMKRKMLRMLRKSVRLWRISGIHSSVKMFDDNSGANILKHIRRGKYVKTLRFNGKHTPDEE